MKTFPKARVLTYQSAHTIETDTEGSQAVHAVLIPRRIQE